MNLEYSSPSRVKKRTESLPRQSLMSQIKILSVVNYVLLVGFLISLSGQGSWGQKKNNKQTNKKTPKQTNKKTMRVSCLDKVEDSI